MTMQSAGLKAARSGPAQVTLRYVGFIHNMI